MMALDMFTRDRDEAITYALRNSERDLPATFDEAFGTSWNAGRLFSQSIAGINAREAAIDDYADEVARATGQRLQYLTPEGFSDVASIRDQVTKMRAVNPALNVPDLTDDEIDRRAIERSRQARSELAALAQRERTAGGSLGYFLGNAATGFTDPVNLLTLPMAAPVSAGLLRTALAWGVIAGTTQAGVELLGAPYREMVQPGYGASAEPAGNVLGATAFGSALGGGIKGTSMLWQRAKSGAWPQYVRDAGKVVESEAQAMESNPFPPGSVDGEMAHRAAVSKAVDDVAAGRPVDLDPVMTPELQATYEERFTHISDAIERARDTKAAEDVGDVAFELQGMARQAGYVLQRQEADTVAARLVDMPPDEARAALDEFLQRPVTLAETIPDRANLLGEAPAAADPRERVYGPALAEQTTPERAAAIAKEPATDDAVLNNLDRLRAQRPDVEIPIGETIGADGKSGPVMRKVEDIMAEAEARETAANEILACVMPQPGIPA